MQRHLSFIALLFCCLLLPSSIFAQTTTAAGDSTTTTVDNVCSESDGWCAQPNQTIPRYVAYLTIAGLVLVAGWGVRHERKALFILLVWAGNLFGYWYIVNDVLWNMLLVLDFILYYFLFVRTTKSEFDDE